LFNGSSFPSNLSAKNIINVNHDFILLKQLWEKGPQTMSELYLSDSVSQNYSYKQVEKSVIRFYENGFVKPASKQDSEQKVQAVYTLKEMIRIVAELYDRIPVDHNSEREILADFLHNLIKII
jgi:hypothetical protein